MGDVLTFVHEAAAIIGRGGLVVVPTETVYGIVGKPDADAIARIIGIKERPAEKSIQLLIPGAGWLERFADPSPYARALADAFWPGPLTLVMTARDDAPSAVVTEGTIGVRVPAHPIALDLLARCGPLAASSANASGEPTPSSIDAIRSIFGDRIDGYLDGGIVEGTGSTVVDVTSGAPRILREGPITATQIQGVDPGGFARG